MKSTKYFIIALLFFMPLLSMAQSDTSQIGEYEIEENYIVVELDSLEFHQLTTKFKEDFELSTSTLTAWFSTIATMTESMEIEFSDEHIKLMMKGELVPFPATSAAIRGHIYSYYLTKP